MHTLFFNILFFFWGCRHQIQIQSTPIGAEVYWKDDMIGVTPLTTTFWWYPGKTIRLNIQYKGYRTLSFPVHSSINSRIILRELVHLKWRQLTGFTPRGYYNILLIKDHGPAGTWTPEDAKNFK